MNFGRLRIGIVAPPWYSVPPQGYGGTELVVYLLARELQRVGHEVKVFGASSPDRGLGVEPMVPSDWGGDLGSPDQRFREATYVHRVYRLLDPCRFDLIHDHTETAGPVVAALLNLECPVVATVHSALGEPQVAFLKEVDRSVNLVAISEAQRCSAPDVRWAGAVHNALDESALQISEEKDDYVVELGRICSDKGQHIAIQVAHRLGLPLVLAGKVDPSPEAQAYFSRKVAPYFGRGVTWIPNVSGTDKARLLARARAMLFPLDWEEPFGIAMVEAMASGTPVIAFPRGAAPELIEDGVTGFLVKDADEMAEAYQKVQEIDPRACARRARDRFSPRRMAEGYQEIYRNAVGTAPVPAFMELPAI